MNRKTLVLLVTLYAGALAATWASRYLLNALTIMAVVLVLIAASVLVNRSIPARSRRTAAIVSTALFAIFLVAFTALVLTGDSLQAITANSGALNSGHIQVTLDQPVQNTLVSVLICALAHWRLGAGSRATSVPE